MNSITLALQAVLGLLLVGLAIASTFRPRHLAFLDLPLLQSRAGRWASTALFLVAGVATGIGAMVPFIVFFAACLAFLSSVVLAVGVDRSKTSLVRAIPAFIALGAVALAIAQPLGLKVLALPKADDLAVHPASARVVKTYDEGLWLEGIAADAEGNLYLAGNRGLDFSRGDYYREAHGEVILRKPDGQERVIFQTPVGSTAGVITVAADGSLYMTSHSDASVIWKIATDGQAMKLAQLPTGSWPNGIDIGPDGMLYSPDSSLGAIWRVSPKTGALERVIDDKLLRARPLVALAPGANGLHFQGRDMYVTVSDRTTVLKYALNDDGRFGAAVTVASGIPGDDFAIGRDGSLFITTHPYNTVVRVAPGGIKTTIANAAQNVIGATAAVFGKTALDAATLYVVTDGGAFTGGPKTRGQLIALQAYDQK